MCDRIVETTSRDQL